MKSSDWLVGVVVPARNEQDSIAECVSAIRLALASCTYVRSSWIVIAADSCSDRTAERARSALAQAGEVVECAAQSPGTARRIGVAALLRRFDAADSSRLWIANTDADSTPGTDWIDQQLALARRGYAAVAGVVRVDSIEGFSGSDTAALLEHYVTNEDGSHPHVHGANLGIRADAYVDVGGWTDLPLAEDHCLWARVRARSWPAIATTASVVTTSGRLIGRAAGGFADNLRRRAQLRYA